MMLNLLKARQKPPLTIIVATHKQSNKVLLGLGCGYGHQICDKHDMCGGSSQFSMQVLAFYREFMNLDIFHVP